MIYNKYYNKLYYNKLSNKYKINFPNMEALHTMRTLFWQVHMQDLIRN